MNAIVPLWSYSHLLSCRTGYSFTVVSAWQLCVVFWARNMHCSHWLASTFLWLCSLTSLLHCIAIFCLSPVWLCGSLMLSSFLCAALCVYWSCPIFLCICLCPVTKSQVSLSLSLSLSFSLSLCVSVCLSIYDPSLFPSIIRLLLCRT